MERRAIPVNEIFETIQGEATWTGTPSVFVRLQGCDVGCPWCDTKHTWKIDPSKAVGSDAMIAKVEDNDQYANMNPGHLADIIGHHKSRHVVITGGEPCEYNLIELTNLLHTAGRTTQIETSGTRIIQCSSQTFVTVSPKFNMPGGYPVLEEALDRANEIKMPVGKPADIERVKALSNRVWRRDPKPLIWLQPLSTSRKATELCIESAKNNGWRLSVQTHKFIGVR